VVYELDVSDREALDLAEPGYTPIDVEVRLDDARVVEALTYWYEPEGTERLPADWYLGLVTSGAAHHGLGRAYISSRLRIGAAPEQGLTGLRPASAQDLPAMQQILSASLMAGGGRYTTHPGELAWWIWHEDPRHSDRISYWTIHEEVVLVITAGTNEIDVGAISGRNRIAFIEWAQRRLRGQGRVAAVAETDDELVEYLKSAGYRTDDAHRRYHWDLQETDVPEPELPDGWELRHIAGEKEARERRRASHAAFRSTMESETHLQRYLRFMRSPVYQPKRDLVAVSPEGRIASFMVWWPDESGIAQIEPFGTHPEFQRRGFGKALIHYGLRAMRDEGMTLCRVTTDESRTDATAFYESIGFQDVGSLRWWRKS